ncbi:MAG TPA: hydantoinase B/oxoprolinase family protein [Xanthomonadales bacterium]|nr:hydantoinase B/oxoprolinase family protein [Xanthomonadales bacterium]
MTGIPFDGARLAIMSNRFEGIARKMANTLYRTGRSGVLNRARDFSCCIVTRDCELLAAAESLPIHVLAGPDQMAAAMHQFHPELKRGDAFLHNSPYHGCSHPADHTILVPVIDNDGVHQFTVVAKAHQADIGNSIPTTYHGAARDVYEEGALIFPCVQVERGYRTIKDIVRMCEMRIRVAEQWKGDFLAMLGSARIGEREIMVLADELGWGYLHEFASQWLDYSERRMINAIRALPAGRATSSSTHDPFPGTPEEGVTINATITVDPEAATVEVDLLDNPDALPCGLNVSEACTRTSCLIGVFNSIDHTVPKNAGSFRRVQMKLKQGGVVGVPQHPTSCSVATTNLADRIAAAVQTAFSKIADGIGMAEIGAVIPPAAGVISGVDPRTGKAFVNQLFLGATGGGAGPLADCWMTYCHVGNGGLCYLDSIELDEIYQPIHVHARYLMPDTEGAGRYRGAPSLFVEYGPVNCGIEIGYVSDGVHNTAKGVLGGGNGHGAEQFRRTKSGDLQLLDACAQVRLLEGETVVSISCGGGGYGPASERDPEKVRHDVQEGWITQQRAREVYRVALDAKDEVDIKGTAALRSA